MGGIGVYGLASTSTEIRLFVVEPAGRSGEFEDPRPSRLDVSGRTVELTGPWYTSAIGDGKGSLRWCKPVVDGLSPGTPYTVALHGASGEVLDTARAWTLPAAAAGFRLVAGSCYDSNNAALQDLLDGTYQMLDENSSDVACFNVWLGDQVYVDAPWTKGTRPRNARRVIFDRYQRTWGVTGSSNFGAALSKSSNWFLPDDHEFWNGYPDPSWLTLFGHTLKRAIHQLVRLIPKVSGSPHPYAQGEWGRAAGDAYCVFASSLEFEAFSEEVSPPQVQQLSTEHVLVVLVDTRWHRTIRKQLLGAGFMRDEDLDELIKVLTTDDRVVCVVIPKPLIGYLPMRGATRGGKTNSEGKFDVGPEFFSRQYTKLWKALSDRRDENRPTLVIAGDVHRHSIRRALDDGLLEIVSSPVAELSDLTEKSFVSRVRAAYSKLKDLVRGAEVKCRPALQTEVDHAYPRFGANDEWEAAAGNVVMDRTTHISGLTGIEFDVADSRYPRVTVRSVRQQSSGAINPVTMQTFEFVWENRWNLAAP